MNDNIKMDKKKEKKFPTSKMEMFQMNVIIKMDIKKEKKFHSS